MCRRSSRGRSSTARRWSPTSRSLSPATASTGSSSACGATTSRSRIPRARRTRRSRRASSSTRRSRRSRYGDRAAGRPPVAHRFRPEVRDRRGRRRRAARARRSTCWDLVRADRPGKRSRAACSRPCPGRRSRVDRDPKPWKSVEAGGHARRDLPRRRRARTPRKPGDPRRSRSRPRRRARTRARAAGDARAVVAQRSGGYEIQVVARSNGVADLRRVVHRTRQGGCQRDGQRDNQGDGQRAAQVGGQATARGTSGSICARRRPPQGRRLRLDRCRRVRRIVTNSTVEVPLAAEDGAGTLAETSKRAKSASSTASSRFASRSSSVRPPSIDAPRRRESRERLRVRPRRRAEESVHGSRPPPYNTLGAPRRGASRTSPTRSELLPRSPSSSTSRSCAPGTSPPASWPTNSPPDANRKRVLERARVGAAGPARDRGHVGGGSLREVGREAPSVARRMGVRRARQLRRPFASAANPPKAPSRKDVNFDPEGDGDGRGRARREDVAADTGRDLCRNVAEWTATPASFLVRSTAPSATPRIEHRTGSSIRGTARGTRRWSASGSRADRSAARARTS